ncbi:hypothetical protein CMQ_4820 [Grosmannia clavigera kw1407]|uniref:Uncharacterized protein n=1 Tax=Grosmannia clavigera (strain kw1407 / UAMH 11150) TaxID=655863 RepID=F0XV72_GROCL|nr:uncharacterized protein CMQ_4820 [Grosmannia clavigera kw1407]EFW98968.1 hypothetical protein CMQ_4820 [Grosmannia clavigera kw1407]
MAPSTEVLTDSTDSRSPTIAPGYAQLFGNVEAALSTTSLGPCRWYIVAMSCVVAGPDPDIAAAQLYCYLCAQPQYKTPQARQKLIRRLREALLKAISIVGVCKPLEAILAIAAIERPEDRDYGMTREGWQCDSANLSRGMEWLQKIYAQNSSDTLGLFAAHRDFEWISKNITYGLYLGDRQVLDDLDTEMVVLPAIMSQNLKTETWWHIRGTRRIGVSKADTKVLWNTIKNIAAHYGQQLDRVPGVDEVERDV